VEGSRSERVRGKQSLTIEGDQHEKVGRNHALATKRKLTMRSGATLVGEAQDVTLRSKGGFIRLDATGVTISGTIVNINTGDAKPGKGGDSNPADPLKAKQRVPEE
jgi:type VI secretion system secreted protein VgrG